MCSSSKVFIVNSQGVGPNSAADLGEFFRTSRAIFDAQPDVVVVKDPFNADGLICPTFVVPGGSTLAMGHTMKPIFDVVKKSTVGDNFNYVGICAGAFLGTAQSDIFVGSPYFSHGGEIQGLGLVDEYKTVGAFCPVGTVNPSTRPLVPYSVSISLSVTRQPSRQLYVNGPGFFAVKTDHDSDVEVVARYADRESYEFPYRHGKVSSENLPAMISKKANASRGGRFLSGVHFEACVENSRLLKAFESSTVQVEGLTLDEYALLGDAAEQANTRSAVEVLLRRTLK